MDLTRILDKQSEYQFLSLEKALETVTEEVEIYQAYARSLAQFRDTSFRKMASVSNLERFNQLNLETFINTAKADLGVVGFSLQSLISDIGETYNAVQDFGTSVRNRTQYYTSLITDLKILNEEDTDATLFRDCLTDYTFIDVSAMTGSQTALSTAEGIAHLAISQQSDLSAAISEVRITGNGEAGCYNIARILNIDMGVAGNTSLVGFESDIDSHDNPIALSDSEAQTWYEYQKLGADNILLPRADARISGESLILKIQILFKEPVHFNWIDISPYLPEGLTSPMRVYSIRVSADGVQYSPLYKDKEILDIPLHMISQRYILDIGEVETVRYNSQGVFLCPESTALGIELIIKQDKAYAETLAVYKYDWVVEKDGQVLSRIQQDEARVPEAIRQGLPGKYTL